MADVLEISRNLTRMNLNTNRLDSHDRLLNHILLPRFISTEAGNDIVTQEASLLLRMSETIRSNSTWLPPNTVQMFESFHRVHQSRNNAKVIFDELNDLQPGDTFAMNVRCQNAVFMCHMPMDAGNNNEIDEKTPVIVATFPGQVNAKEIYAHPMDLEMTYPVRAITVNYSKMLRSMEFAQQLSLLCDELPIQQKEKATNRYLSEWLMAVLITDKSVPTPTNKFPMVTKKIRDECTKIGESAHWFRRSAVYTAMKAILHHNLVLLSGAVNGHIQYKLILIRFMNDICKSIAEMPYERMNIDLMSQMIAKMARRIEKINDEFTAFQKADKNLDHLEEIVESTFDDVKMTISTIRVKIDKQISELQMDFVEEAELMPLKGLSLIQDSKHDVPKLRHYIEKRQAHVLQTTKNHQLIVNAVKRHYNKRQAPGIGSFGECGSEFLRDFEWFVLYELSMEGNQITPIHALEYMEKYCLEMRFIHTTGDKLGISRAILTQLKLLAVIDRAVCQKYPLLHEYRPSINFDWFAKLLLPHRVDMEVANEIENYFRQRQLKATHVGLIDSDKITANSFAVRYAAKSVEMKRVLTKIVDAANVDIENKRIEWTNERVDVLLQRNLANQMLCQTSINKNGEEAHYGGCNRCELKRQLKHRKIEQYEYPLPSDINQQYAVVFELMIPKEIAHLRDAFFLFSKFGGKKELDHNICQWSELPEIRQFNHTSKRQLVRLGHMPAIKKRTFHVDVDFESFILRNSRNCIYHINGTRFVTPLTLAQIHAICTLPVESNSQYSNLQWMINDTTHTQNEVFARQNECATTLSLNEFKNFGSLRADGCRLQWRQLFAMLESDALAFEQQSVLALCLQAIWEQNENGTAYGWRRKANGDMNNWYFVEVMVNGIDTYLNRQRNNWMHPLKLLLIAAMATRLFEINKVDGDDAIVNQENILKLLRKIREISIEWRGKIEQALQAADNPNDERNMREKLILAMVAGCISFSIHPAHTWFEETFQAEDACIWLQLIVTLNNNKVLLDGGQPFEDPFNMEMWLQFVQNIGINLEPALRTLITANPTIVKDYMRNEWMHTMGSRFENIRFMSKCPQTLVGEIFLNGVRSNVTIDIVSGLFLVNGSPTVRLPATITSSQLYRTVFKNISFEVQLNAQNVYVSKNTYNGCSYAFNVLANGSIAIIERDSNGSEMELIPPIILEGEIPSLLHSKYSHWWHKTNNSIEFRPKCFAATDFKTNIEYTLDLKQYYLIHTQTNRRMLDVTSKSFRQIADQLQRLECDKFLHIYLKSDANGNDSIPTAHVELVRMRLKFETSGDDECSDLISNEFCGMKVSLNQNCGSLYGLREGLILESVADKFEGKASKPKILLMPHGKVIVQRAGSHVNVEVDAELRSPPFHQYQIDEFGRQIRSNNSSYSAWLYLAYLHAITSHGEIEPLLGMSGTERALQILQSGFVWSSAPYDAEAWKILSEIAKLSPVRRLDESKRSQIIEWPSKIPPRSAQDSYVFIVRRLIEDSERLKDLYSNKSQSKKSITFKTSFELNQRDYLRHRALAPNSCISNAFIKNQKPKTWEFTPKPTHFSENTQKIAILYHNKGHQLPESGAVEAILSSQSELNGLTNNGVIENLLNHMSYEDLCNIWIELYDAARQQNYTPEQFTLILTLLELNNRNSMALILALHAVVMHPKQFSHIIPPNVPEYNLSLGVLSWDAIKAILNENVQYPEGFHNWKKPQKLQYTDSVGRVVSKFTSTVFEALKNESVKTYSMLNMIPADVKRIIRTSTAIPTINRVLPAWRANAQLKRFLQTFENQLHRLYYTVSVKTLQLGTGRAKKTCLINRDISRDTTISPKFSKIHVELKEARQIWFEGEPLGQRSLHEWWEIYKKVAQPNSASHLIDAGLAPRCVPSVALPQIASSSTNRRLKALIGVIALSTVHEQRHKRIALFESQMKQPADHEHEPHTNWRPSDYPEWLLFEIEQNVCIRRIQIEVAKRMIDPPDIGTKHSVMQLNMGEGKTSVIVPILAAYLANGKQVCQITVLKSLYATNAKSLRQYLGGMLNRKLYHFPCRRDMPIEQYSEKLLKIYEECSRDKGVILTLPEYRCSFQLKLYETVQKGQLKHATNLLKIHNWIQENARNILDESDAILHAKYQMIYTIGNQLPIDGGEHRWLVSQAVMKRVSYHMSRLYHTHGDEKIEFDDEYLQNHGLFGADRVDSRSDVFTPCRLLDQAIFEDLKKELIEDFIAGRISFPFPEMVEATKRNMRILLSHKQINKDTFEAVLQKFSKQEQNSFMILSGLLRFEVLRLILSKRWRVNYGVNVNGPRKMAVPFKAKDVAAEMTEFGHADVAICFTLLSYYYSGLTSEQLHHVFRLLHKIPNASEIYEQWLSNIPDELIDASIRSYTGINLCDPHQRDDFLFPLFRFNMNVIDFWLSQAVFPREAKTFEQKLMCTAWDLCSESFNHPVTGFSGTNDTKNILPLPIQQNDLKELEDTNDKVRAILLQPENQLYEPLPANVSAKEILTTLIDQYIPVLLDAGALMLELNNEQVAREWLRMTTDCWYDAAVYFDDRDVLQTIDRNGVRTEFDCSVYRDKLDRCLVYLDDTHTRGTDLKFPLNRRACVTLSGEITRDKTVQACMRMRKLGNGQSIAFYASYEADIRIRETCKLSKDDVITNEHVIEFISHNSREFEVENMSYWTLAAYNYVKKWAGHEMHGTARNNSAALEQLYEKCVDSEYIELTELYGDKTDLFLSDIAQGKFNQLIKLYKSLNLGQALAAFILSISENVQAKIKDQAPKVRRFIHTLDDQQEKELEHETEQQCQIQYAAKAVPCKPKLDPNLVKWLETGQIKWLVGVVPMAGALKNTSLHRNYSNSWSSGWSSHLYVTQDFINVVQKAENVDEYLRPVWWIAQTKVANTNKLICLSTYECNRLMDIFEESEISTLFMYRPRLSRFHSNLADIDGLQVLGGDNFDTISLDDIVQIGMFAGGTYFATEDEQNAYCQFMGLIPRPRTPELMVAFRNGRIQANGYVGVAHRKSKGIKDVVGKCEFKVNPVDLAIKIIEARNQNMNTECHVAWILKKGVKKQITIKEDSGDEEN